MGKVRKGDQSAVVKAAPESVKNSTIDSSSKTKSTKKKAVPVSATETVAAPVATPVAPTLVQEETTDHAPESLITESFSEFMAKLQTLASQMNALKTEFRLLEKKAVREIKTAAKINAKRRRKSSNRSPSGFVKPTLISDELANFLNKPLGTEMARTEVTREINGYIRAHSLQDKQNGRKINPDLQLAKLLKIEDGQELTYFNLQRYMSPHFAKASPKVAGQHSTTA